MKLLVVLLCVLSTRSTSVCFVAEQKSPNNIGVIPLPPPNSHSHQDIAYASKQVQIDDVLNETETTEKLPSSYDETSHTETSYIETPYETPHDETPDDETPHVETPYDETPYDETTYDEASYDISENVHLYDVALDTRDDNHTTSDVVDNTHNVNEINSTDDGMSRYSLSDLRYLEFIMEQCFEIPEPFRDEADVNQTSVSSNSTQMEQDVNDTEKQRAYRRFLSKRVLTSPEIHTSQNRRATSAKHTVVNKTGRIFPQSLSSAAKGIRNPVSSLSGNRADKTETESVVLGEKINSSVVALEISGKVAILECPEIHNNSYVSFAPSTPYFLPNSSNQFLSATSEVLSLNGFQLLQGMQGVSVGMDQQQNSFGFFEQYIGNGDCEDRWDNGTTVVYVSCQQFMDEQDSNVFLPSNASEILMTSWSFALSLVNESNDGRTIRGFGAVEVHSETSFYPWKEHNFTEDSQKQIAISSHVRESSVESSDPPPDQCSCSCDDFEFDKSKSKHRVSKLRRKRTKLLPTFGETRNQVAVDGSSHVPEYLYAVTHQESSFRAGQRLSKIIRINVETLEVDVNFTRLVEYFTSFTMTQDGFYVTTPGSQAIWRLDMYQIRHWHSSKRHLKFTKFLHHDELNIPTDERRFVSIPGDLHCLLRKSQLLIFMTENKTSQDASRSVILNRTFGSCSGRISQPRCKRTAARHDTTKKSPTVRRVEINHSTMAPEPSSDDSCVISEVGIPTELVDSPIYGNGNIFVNPQGQVYKYVMTSNGFAIEEVNDDTTFARKVGAPIARTSARTGPRTGTRKPKEMPAVQADVPSISDSDPHPSHARAKEPDTERRVFITSPILQPQHLHQGSRNVCGSGIPNVDVNTATARYERAIFVEQTATIIALTVAVSAMLIKAKYSLKHLISATGHPVM